MKKKSSVSLKTNLLNLKNRIAQSKRLWVYVASTASLVVIAFSFTETYVRFENALYDLRFRIKPAPKEWSRLALVDIDDQSIASVGEFPWQRNLYEPILDGMRDAGASQMIFDIQLVLIQKNLSYLLLKYFP